MKTLDQKTIDSTGIFITSELERLDKTLHEPLVEVTWGRDIELRTDVSIADEISSYTRTDFAAAGANSRGKNWVSGDASEIAGIVVKESKDGNPMYLWGMELAFDVIEIARSQQVGRPIDKTKHTGLQLKHQMDTDEMVYIGDSHLGKTGLVNNTNIAPVNVSTNWATATPKEILDDINGLIEQAWKQTGYAICPSDIRLAPESFAKLTQPVTAAGSKSILSYVAEECLSYRINGRMPSILPLKWLSERGVGGVNRALAYTRAERFVRFPMVPLQRTPVEYRGLKHLTTYYGTLGVTEFVYPETVAYCDGM